MCLVREVGQNPPYRGSSRGIIHFHRDSWWITMISPDPEWSCIITQDHSWYDVKRRAASWVTHDHDPLDMSICGPFHHDHSLSCRIYNKICQFRVASRDDLTVILRDPARSIRDPQPIGSGKIHTHTLTYVSTASHSFSISNVSEFSQKSS